MSSARRSRWGTGCAAGLATLEVAWRDPGYEIRVVVEMLISTMLTHALHTCSFPDAAGGGRSGDSSGAAAAQ